MLGRSTGDHGRAVPGPQSGAAEGETSPPSWPQTLAVLRRTFSASTCAVAVHDYEGSNGRLVQTSGIQERYVQSYQEGYACLNTWLLRETFFRLPGQVWTGEQLVGQQEALKAEFYLGWLKPQNLYYQMFGVLDRQCRTVVCLYLARSPNHGAFTGADAASFSALLPALASAWRMERRARAEAWQSAASWNVLNNLALGVVLIDEDWRVLGANKRALEVLASQDALKIVEGRVTCRAPKERELLRQALDAVRCRAAAQSKPFKKGLLIRRSERASPLHLILSPVPCGTPIRGNRGSLIALFVFDPDCPGQPQQEWLCDLYGLTRVEADIAVRVCREQTPAAIARDLRISVHTVRGHLKTIFLKMDVRRQSGVVRRVLAELGQL